MRQTANISKHNFILLNGDLFSSINNIVSTSHSSTIIVPHVCNNVDVFGGGFTAGITKHHPIVKDNYHMLGPSFLKKNLGYTQFVVAKDDKKNNNQIVFANMISQNGTISSKNKRPINYLALCRSMVAVSKYIKEKIDKDQSVQIHAPKFGSGLAGGNWGFISYLIDDIWEGLPVFIYDFGR